VILGSVHHVRVFVYREPVDMRNYAETRIMRSGAALPLSVTLHFAQKQRTAVLRWLLACSA
jgi:hypothetical protein